MSYKYYKKKLTCPRGEIGRHKGLKRQRIHILINIR